MTMIEKGDLVLVNYEDHQYRKADVYYTHVVRNKRYGEYSEYVGVEYLAEDEEVVMAWVVE